MSYNYIQLHSGQKFYIENPTVDQIHASDIAHSLAGKGRYNCHSKKLYSVAEHSVHIAKYLMGADHDLDMILWGLLHDATETYMPDFPRPWKQLPQFEFVREAEDRLMAVIAERFELVGRVIPEEVNTVDMRILCDESEQVFLTGPVDDWGQKYAPGLGVTIEFWTPEKAEHCFFTILTDLIQLRQETQRRAVEG